MKKQVPENPAKNRTSQCDWLVIITALTVTCYITSNLMAVKLVEVGGRSWFDGGTITFPLTYMLGDVLTEIWGFKTAKKVIFLTFLCNLLLIVCTYIGVFLPSPEYIADTAEAYDMIFTITPRILIASLTAFLAGELSNAWVMVAVKRMTKGRYLFVRTIISSAVGYIFDTVLFVIFAFGGTAPVCDLVTLMIAQYMMKLIMEIVFSTPLSYGAVAFLKKKVGIIADE